jgi:hypothetical protein
VLEESAYSYSPFNPTLLSTKPDFPLSEIKRIKGENQVFFLASVFGISHQNHQAERGPCHRAAALIVCGARLAQIGASLIPRSAEGNILWHGVVAGIISAGVLFHELTELSCQFLQTRLQNPGTTVFPSPWN